MSPVSIGQVSSDVATEPAPVTTDSAPAPRAPWELEDEACVRHDALVRDRDRTRCEGFDA